MSIDHMSHFQQQACLIVARNMSLIGAAKGEFGADPKEVWAVWERIAACATKEEVLKILDEYPPHLAPKKRQHQQIDLFQG